MNEALEQSDISEHMEHTLNCANTSLLTLNKNWQRQIQFWFCLVVFGLCLLPLANLWYTIATIGGNNISNDYLLFLPTLDRILSGTYNWGHFVTDTVYMGHWCSLSVLVHIFIALVSRWDARFELYLGSFFALLRLALLALLLSDTVNGKAKLLIIGGLAALVFSNSQAANFLYGQNAIAVNLCLLGFTLGLWGLAKVKRPWYGLAIMAVGGLISSASFGNVLPCWLSFLVALPVFGYKRWQYYFAWLTAFVLGIYPYVNYLLFSHRSAFSTVQSTVLQKYFMVINVLGRPFCNGIGLNCGRLPMAEFVGLTGLLIACLSIWAIFSQRFSQGEFNNRSRVSFVLVIYGLLSVCIVSMVRILVIPVYTFLSINFWIGIFGLSISLIQNSIKTTKSPVGTKFGVLGLADLLLMVCLYIVTNRTYADKTTFPLARTPASEAVIRNYRTAPTYCEDCVFQFGVGQLLYFIYLAEPLERLGLSTFAPHQDWSLQGDFPLHNVSVHRTNKQSSIRWILENDPRKRDSWRSYKHLNLCLPTKSRINWELSLPDNLISARFTTAVRNAKNFDLKSSQAISKFSLGMHVFEETNANNSRLFQLQEVKVADRDGWIPLSMDLTKFKGKQVCLSFDFDGTKGTNQAGVWQYPHMDIQLDASTLRNKSRQPAVLTPSNTDISPYFPRVISNSFCFPKIASKAWSSGEILVSPDTHQTTPYESMMPLISFKITDKLDLQDYTHLYAEVSAPARVYPRVLRIRLTMANNAVKWLVIPLLDDDSIHKYTYDLKLLELGLDKEALLKEIAVFPVTNKITYRKGTVSLKSLKLIEVSNKSI